MIFRQEALSFDDVILLPQYSEVESRSNVDLSMTLYTHSDAKYVLALPVISSPMDTVTGQDMAYYMSINGGLGILHRYCSIEEEASWVRGALGVQANGDPGASLVGASVGATGDYLERAQALVAAGAKVICIDIAHGHHKFMREALRAVSALPTDVHIMAGNVATAEGYLRLAEWGANSVRVGISSGAACATAINTGHGLPTLQSIMDVQERRDNRTCGVIADGGIKVAGDAVKSYAAGADFVMLGSLLAGAKCSPGEVVIQSDGKWVKSYRGSASFAAQKNRGQVRPRVEGVSGVVLFSNKLENTLDPLRDGLQSGCSYSGVNSLSELAEIAEFAKVTQSGFLQGTPHILGR